MFEVMLYVKNRHNIKCTFITAQKHTSSNNNNKDGAYRSTFIFTDTAKLHKKPT